MWDYKIGEKLDKNKGERKGTVKLGRDIYERMKPKNVSEKEQGRENKI